jgi:hypothetical protein
LKGEGSCVGAVLSLGETWSQSYDRELQRQRRNNLQHHEQPSAFVNKDSFFYFEKNALACYNVGVVVVNYEVV